MNRTVVHVENMGKTYQMGHGLVRALIDVNLVVKEGDCLAIMGPSGSGKSTLMHLLGCLDKPTQGSYQLNGIDISTLDDDALSSIRSHHIGFVFQSFNLVPQLSVLDNVKIPFLYRNDSLHEEKAIEALRRVGLQERIHHFPTQLSGGEMQRAAIARALVINPALILADEPTGNLDHKTGRAILTLFEELNAGGVTLIMVTHDESIGQRCKRILRMQDGSVLKEEAGCVA